MLLDLGGTRQQIVLATLPLSANTVVTVGRLGEARPAGALQSRRPVSANSGRQARICNALELAGEADDPLAAAQACLGLAELALASGAPDCSVVLAEHAVDAFRKMGTRHGEREALRLLGEASSARANRAAADAAATRAASLPENG